MTKAEAEALVKKHGGVVAAARAAGCAHATIGRAIRRGGNQPAARTAAAAPAHGKSLAEFRGQYDKNYIVPRRIREGLQKLDGGWEYEVQFAKLAGVSLADLSAFRDQFADHIIALRRDSKRAWAATKTLATQMREMVG